MAEMIPQQAQRLLAACRKWAAFQEPDSLEDQQHCIRLANEAIEARESLLALIDALEAVR